MGRLTGSVLFTKAYYYRLWQWKIQAKELNKIREAVGLTLIPQTRMFTGFGNIPRIFNYFLEKYISDERQKVRSMFTFLRHQNLPDVDIIALLIKPTVMHSIVW